MQDAILIVLTLGGSFFMLVVGGLIGSAIESNHLKRLTAEEHALSNVMLSSVKRIPPNWNATGGTLVTGEAVIATDYFKVFVAALRNLFGGRVRTYEILVERARREAVVRMLRQGEAAGANVVWNVRIETSTIQGKQQGKSGGIEVLAYGTALRIES